MVVAGCLAPGLVFFVAVVPLLPGAEETAVSAAKVPIGAGGGPRAGPLTFPLLLLLLLLLGEVCAGCCGCGVGFDSGSGSGAGGGSAVRFRLGGGIMGGGIIMP